MKHPTKKENNYNKLNNDFEDGKLSRTQLHQIPFEQCDIYLKKQLSKYYKEIHFICHDCTL